MTSQEFTVLYTHQKTKKSKTWQDGILRIRTGRNQAVLFDDKGQCLESIFMKSQVDAGDNLESERYLITIEAVRVNEKSCEDQPRETETPAVDGNGVKPGVLPRRRLPVGLKRKFTGFQVPRQVEKKTPTMENGENTTILPSSKQCQSPFPSKFYNTSPLFSTICQKDAETNLSADFHEDVRVDHDREQISLSSLLSPQFLDRCEDTEKQNSGQSVVKAESSVTTAHLKSSNQAAGPRAVSQNVRSTAQIIALLKSKPTEEGREQTRSGVTGCLSGFHASGNTGGFYNQKSTFGNPAKRFIQNTQHLPFTTGTVNDHEWNAEMLNSTEQPCAEVTRQRHDKKLNYLSRDLQDVYNQSICFLPVSTVDGMGDSQVVPSSGDVSCLPSPVTFEKNLFGSRGYSVTDGLKENSSVELPSELQPEQNSGEPGDLELSVDVTLSKVGITQEELGMRGKDCGLDEEVMEVNFNLVEDFDFNDMGNEHPCERDVNKLTEGDALSQIPGCLKGEDAAKNAFCEVVTHSKNEGIGFSTGDLEDDATLHPGVEFSQLCDSNIRNPERMAEDCANQPRTEVEPVVDGYNIKEVSLSQLSIEATNNKDLDACASCDVTGKSWIKSKHSDLLHGDANVTECHPKTSLFEEMGNISSISASQISTRDKRTEEDIGRFGCMKSQEVDLEHVCTESGDSKPSSPLLAWSQKWDSSCGELQRITEGQRKVCGTSPKEGSPISRGSVNPSCVEKTELESVESVNDLDEACQGGKTGMACLKCTATAEMSSDLPDLVNDIALLRALTQHSTALESLQEMEENNSRLYEAETSKDMSEPLGKDEAIEQFTEMPYSESIQASSCSYFDSSGLMPNCVDNGFQKADACIEPTVVTLGDRRTPDCQPKPVAFQGYPVKGSASSEMMLRAPCSQLGWRQHPENTEFAAQGFFSSLFSSNYVLSEFRQSPDSRSLHEDDINFIRDENFQQQSNLVKDSRRDRSSLALNVSPEVAPWSVPGSPSRAGLSEMQWASWEPDKVVSLIEPTSSFDPDSESSPASASEETIGDVREPLIHRTLPTGPDLSEVCYTQDKSSYPEECSLSRFKPAFKTRSPFVTRPAAEKIPDSVDPTDSEKFHQSFGSSGVHLGDDSVVFPISAFGLEGRNSDTSVFGEYAEGRQKEYLQPVLSNVTLQRRQSKWLKYQSSAQGDSITENSDDGEVTDDTCAETDLGMLLSDTGESGAASPSAPGSAALGSRCANTSARVPISERKLFSLRSSWTPLTEATQKVLSHLSCHTATGDGQGVTISELCFPNVDQVKHVNILKRKVSIPTVFPSHVHYKQIFKAALTEQLNILLFEASQRLHHALSKVDVSFYTLKDGQSESQESCVPLCNHSHPAKLVMVKKEGQNKGRLFYTCDAPKAERCSFFKWIEDVNSAQLKSRQSVVLHDIKSIGTYLRSQKIALYEECQLLVRKVFETQTQWCSKFKKSMHMSAMLDGDSKTKLYLKLSKKEHYSLYSKDDIWVVSKTLNFEPLDTFIASSAFFGPSSNNEIELLPLKGYSPSNWRSNVCVHALLVCNASGELTALRNMEEHFNPSTLPLIPHLLKMNSGSENAPKRVTRRKFLPPAISLKRPTTYGPVSTQVAMGLAEEMIQTFALNPDQAASLIRVAQMMTSVENNKPAEDDQIFPITIIRGVFGAGKSYLLSVVVLFLVQLFESSEATEGPRPAPWKLLIASSTNVAIDRILLGLLDLGFDNFIRVGSIRKITKAILPHSLHAGSGNENEQLKELLALMKEDLTPAEKVYVKKSIEQHKLGTNKTRLQQVKVVGVTCAACPFPCLNMLRFPVVMLDECSQITEPASLLPIARFQCEKLVLVGDPKQLPPTIQGSESLHEKGLEQTLFDRLCLMGHKPVLLRTQYRCHPAISAIANELFYEGNLIDGVSEQDRSPLLDWLPTLCFYSVNGVEQMERDNSFYNMAEVHFTVKLLQSLLASGIEGSAIGVITLYKSQMSKIQNLLSTVHSEAFEVKAVQVSTVDAFQGAEKEVIVLSCVRTRHVGFIDSEKRMNVALTRAKRHLLIVGNLACLSRNRLWGKVIHHCKGWENGLQHGSQCEQQLNDILKCYLEKWKEDHQKKKKGK